MKDFLYFDNLFPKIVEKYFGKKLSLPLVNCVLYQVCMIDQKMEEALNIVMPGSEDNGEVSFDEDTDVYGAAGPSERRRKSNNKKKRRSGSLSRVITAAGKGIIKAIRSTTPAGIRSASSHSNDLNK